MTESFLIKNIPEFQYPPWLISCLAFFIFGFSINLFTLFFPPFNFEVIKYPYWSDGELGLMPKVSKPIRQTEEVVQEDIIELPEDLINKLNKGE